MESTDDSPRVYFEEEGWDRAFYLEFTPGTPCVMLGSITISSLRVTLPESPDMNSARDFKTNPVSRKEWDDYYGVYNAARREMYKRISDLTGWQVRELVQRNSQMTNSLR